jgi:penicillin-binding protein-related factor A (putative recombinase)
VTETDLKVMFRKWLTEQGAYFFSPVQTGYGKRTVDDLICFRGQFIAAEAKKPGKYKSPLAGCTGIQKNTLKEVAAAGGLAFAYDDFETAKSLLKVLLP